MKTQIFLLEYPFVLKASPFAERLEQFIQIEIDKYTCLPEKVKYMYRKSNFGKLTANVFPNAEFEELIPMGRWMLVGFAFDDFYGSKSLDELGRMCEKVIDILQGKLPDPDAEEFFHQFSMVKNELLPMATSFWMERFIKHHKIWFEGMKIDTFYSRENRTDYPSLKEYIRIREKIVGGEIICDLMEIAAGFIMPEEVFNHPMIKRLRQLITLMMAWFNDIHSVAWELQRKEAMNLVLVIQNEKNCSQKEAYDAAVKIHDNDLAEFIHITKSLPDFGKYNKGVKKYVHNVELFLKGQESWYFGGTERYTSAGKITS